MLKRFEFPEPPVEALEHSRRLEGHIRESIRANGGWIDFSAYMDLALYAPGLGYYSAGSTKFGPAGDFVTAPEISPLFGRCLARACTPLLLADATQVILELGAGSGALAAEVLTSLARRGALPADYLILEVSAELRERQRGTLERLAPQQLGSVRWLDRLPEVPLRGVVLANEVADALPVSRFTMRDGFALASGVTESAAGFTWAEREAPPPLAAAVAGIRTPSGAALPDGYSSEVCQRLPAWIAAIAACLDAGAFLLCDYGLSRREYYHQDRRDGTLTCHYRHRAHADPFLYPGLQDITAWVDFTAVAGAADRAGLAVGGYSTQAHFLLDAGLDEELAPLMECGGTDGLRAVQQAKTLLLPGEMGEAFKVMALTRGEVTLGGFGFRDLRHLL